MSKFVAVAKVAVDEPKLPIPEGVINRREFLYWLWIASGIILIIGMGFLAAWILAESSLYPILGVDIFEFDVNKIPVPNAEPLLVQGKFWLSNTAAGLYAFNPDKPRCYLYKWVYVNGRFECPGSGAKFQPDGTHVEGPNYGNLDSYPITVIRADGGQQTYVGQPASLHNVVQITVDMRWLIAGQVVEYPN
ncbi:MAG: hypothetical protein KF726_13495 [Anaerolineae bacterium]|nr:hypothetical protein [Anaerolineae bacterium]